MDETISAWIRASGMNPIFLGWIGALCVHRPYRDWETDRKSTRLNSRHITRSRMPSSA